MSIPYIPGWFDVLGPSIMNFAQTLDRRLRPDNYASTALREAMQREPTLAVKISNMTPDERRALAGGFGFRKTDPFAGMDEKG